MQLIKVKMKSIKEWQRKTFGEVVSMYLKEDWYFNQWYEKIILVGLSFLGLWKIMGWIF